MYTHHTHTNVYWLRLFMLTWQSREYREEHNYVRFCACLAITVWIFCVELRCANRNECDVRARMFVRAGRYSIGDAAAVHCPVKRKRAFPLSKQKC